MVVLALFFFFLELHLKRACKRKFRTRVSAREKRDVGESTPPPFNLSLLGRSVRCSSIGLRKKDRLLRG